MSKYNTNDPEAAAIRKKIEKLQSMGREAVLYDVISKEDVELYELANDVKLPEDYVWFITNVGNGGIWEGDWRFYPLDLDGSGFLSEGLPNYKIGQEKFAFEVLDTGCGSGIGLMLQKEHFGEIAYTDEGRAFYHPIPLHGFKEFYLKWLDEACLGYDRIGFESTPHGTIEEHLEQYQKDPDIELLRSIWLKVNPQCAAKQFLSDVHCAFVTETKNGNKVMLARILVKAGYEDAFSVFSAIFRPENYETIVWEMHDSLPYFEKWLNAEGVIADAPKYYPMLVEIMKYYETAKERKYFEYCFAMTVMNPAFRAEDIIGFLTSDDAEIVKCLALVYQDTIRERVGKYIDEAKKKYDKMKEN